MAISLAFPSRRGGGYCSNEDYRLPAFVASRGREGGGDQHPVGTQRTFTTSSLVALELDKLFYILELQRFFTLTAPFGSGNIVPFHDTQLHNARVHEMIWQPFHELM